MWDWSATCPLCPQGELQPGTSDETMSHGDTTIVVKGVPAQVYDLCGQPYFDAETTQRLLDIAWEASQSGILVDVRRYLAA